MSSMDNRAFNSEVETNFRRGAEGVVAYFLTTGYKTYENMMCENGKNKGEGRPEVRRQKSTRQPARISSVDASTGIQVSSY